MKSKTKYIVDYDTIRKMFSLFGITGIASIQKLGAGEFNSVYEVVADKKYVLKIAPFHDTVLTYEKDMMKSEVYWYKILSEQTRNRVPKVYYEDFSKSVVPVNYFIMEKIEGIQKNKLKLSAKNKEKADSEIVKMVSELHKISGQKFGYIQGMLFDTWYDAYRNMVKDLISDCKKAGRRSKRGEKLLDLTNRYKESLETAECCLVNFDCWDPNFICTQQDPEYSFAWIDPERNLWGDRMLDFCCLAMMKPLNEKKEVLSVYNSQSVHKVLATRDENI